MRKDQNNGNKSPKCVRHRSSRPKGAEEQQQHFNYTTSSMVVVLLHHETMLVVELNRPFFIAWLVELPLWLIHVPNAPYRVLLPSFSYTHPASHSLGPGALISWNECSKRAPSNETASEYILLKWPRSEVHKGSGCGCGERRVEGVAMATIKCSEHLSN